MPRTVAFALAAAFAAGCADSSIEPAATTTPLPPAPIPLPPLSPTIEFVFIAQSDGSGATKLTTGAWASWSPDGRRLVFQRGAHRTWPIVPASIYLIDADGARETRLLAGTSPSWSPDGRQIVFVDQEGIEVMDADGSNKRLLLRRNFRDGTNQSSDLGPAKPVWSSDGKRIAFEHLGDGDKQPAQVFVMNADGTNPHRPLITPGDSRAEPYAESDPAWSPDGSMLAYWSEGHGLVIADVVDASFWPLYYKLPGVSYGAKPAWARDQTSMAFNLRTKPGAPRSVVLQELYTGSGWATLVRDGYDLSFSPDRKRIAYTSTRNHDP